MDVPAMLVQEAQQYVGRGPAECSDPGHVGHSSARSPVATDPVSEDRYSAPVAQRRDEVHSRQPAAPLPKTVAFELHFDGSSNARGRLPMRVGIFPHDTTDSIITTVKNFYGLYDGSAGGVSFEDERGNTLIARYENFTDNMVVYVRVVPDYSQRSEHQGPWRYRSASPQRTAGLDDGSQMLPPQPVQMLNYGRPPSRPGSRVSRKQSASPMLSRGQSNGGATKCRSRSGIKSTRSSFQADPDEHNNDGHNGYSSSDGGAGSVTSSRRARSEQLASAEISVDNIVEGGRRKRAKFESSELPLFVPPQVPAPNSISSISPQRRSYGLDHPSPFARPTQRAFTYSVPLQSPQSYAHGELPQMAARSAASFQVPSVPGHGHRLRDRSSGASFSTHCSSISAYNRPRGNSLLPTPDPTVASCISDEDVALQLMRLGDVSNFSHGRMSASTLDDALSGRADAASSATSNSEVEGEASERPPLPANRGLPKTTPMLNHPAALHKDRRRNADDGIPRFDSTEHSGEEADGDYEDGVYRSEADDRDQASKAKVPKTKSTIRARSGSKVKPSKPIVLKKARPSPINTTFQAPISPASLPTQSRKASTASTLNFQHQLGADEDDLSSKPRCQRCRKSKKGCDRQRPCQRCKDAGIGIEGCISEDEGNGRKGRYGRHMGVPVKKTGDGAMEDVECETPSSASQCVGAGTGTGAGMSMDMSMDMGMGMGMALSLAQGNAEKSKKRKR